MFLQSIANEVFLCSGPTKITVAPSVGDIRSEEQKAGSSSSLPGAIG